MNWDGHDGEPDFADTGREVTVHIGSGADGDRIRTLKMRVQASLDLIMNGLSKQIWWRN